MILNREIARLRVTYTNYWIICSWLLSLLALLLLFEEHAYVEHKSKHSNFAPTHVETIFFSSITIFSRRCVKRYRSTLMIILREKNGEERAREWWRDREREPENDTESDRVRQSKKELRQAASTHHSIMMGTSASFLFFFYQFSVNKICGLFHRAHFAAQRAAQFKPIKEGFIK